MRGRSNSLNIYKTPVLVSPTPCSDDEIKDGCVNNHNDLEIKFQNKEKTETKKKILVLDLDDTLIHTLKSSYDSQLHPTISQEKPSKIQLKLKIGNSLRNILSKNQINPIQNYLPVVYDVINLNYCNIDHYVIERPKVREFLQKVCELFEVFIYTSSDHRYAKPIIDNLCPMIDEGHRKYGHLCLVKCDRTYKDLFMFNSLFSDILLVDDNRENLFFWPRNTILCKKFSLNFEKCNDMKDISDNETKNIVDNAGLLIDQNYLMGELLPVLEKCAASSDVRDVIQKSKRLLHFANDSNANFGLSFIESPKPFF